MKKNDILDIINTSDGELSDDERVLKATAEAVLIKLHRDYGKEKRTRSATRSAIRMLQGAGERSRANEQTLALLKEMIASGSWKETARVVDDDGNEQTLDAAQLIAFLEQIVGMMNGVRTQVAQKQGRRTSRFFGLDVIRFKSYFDKEAKKHVNRIETLEEAFSRLGGELAKLVEHNPLLAQAKSALDSIQFGQAEIADAEDEEEATDEPAEAVAAS